MNPTVPLYGEQPPTLTQFIIEGERAHPGATGDFTNIMTGLALAARLISREVNKAGLVDILGYTGRTNVQGEEVQKLDEFANRTMIRCLESTRMVLVMGSEEQEDIIPVSEPDRAGKYVVLFDPLDGSSNIDVGAPIGTIFSIFRRDGDGPGSLVDVLRPGHEQVAAGYVIYGSSTMFIWSAGNGVHGFTLDPSLGSFLLSDENIALPDRSAIYSINEAYWPRWEPPVKNWLAEIKGDGSYTSRYIGSLVADFHRNLLRGGIFAYPGDTRNPSGKLRLLYEASPLAYLIEQAGGAASDGSRRILDIRPADLHQRTPLFIGNRHEIERVERHHRSTQG